MILEPSTLCLQVTEYLEERYKNQGKIQGIPTGFNLLDEILQGFHRTELTIIGSRPSIGKTAFALNLASNIFRAGYSVGIFSLEMASNLLMARLLAGIAEVDAARLRRGLFTEKEFKDVHLALSMIYSKKFYICDIPNIKYDTLRQIAIQMKEEKAIDILFIDYLTLITPQNSYIPRHEQIADLSRKMKGLARGLKIPVVVNSQLRREMEGRYPTLADLRESGAVEQDADVVLLLHRERDKEGELTEDTKLFIAKNRNGPIDIINLKFLSSYTKFISV